MYNANSEEQEILKFWDADKTFEKSVNERPESKPYVFYDGPPFATGLPHYGHIVASLMKDVVPRFWTMKGYRVERRWGWDCHGLPIENIVEKELGTKSKKEIIEMGVAKFNELCRSKVLGYVEDWKKTINRFGRWVDMENAYRTMDRDYMESVWWVFKQLWDKDLIYEDYRSMHICPRCETTLSQQEVSEGYKDVKDISVIVKFELVDEPGTFVLAWTTTPWTLPGNVALAVGKEMEYISYSAKNDKDKVETYILERNAFNRMEIKAVVSNVIHGEDIVGKTYKPLFPYYKDTKNAFRIVAADFVTTEDGTGIVHIAPAFGEDDFKVGKREEIPLVQHVSMDGRFKTEVTDFAGMEVKPRSEDDKVRLAADIAVIRYLQEHGLFFAKQNLVHSYPHCWRCDTPLLNYATSSWFVKVTAIKDKALKLAKKINWSPEHIKEGRFGKWLEGARDWSISRQRFWASVMPIWKCEKCHELEVFGSVADLEKASGQKISDLHKHIVDEVIFPCKKCKGAMKRIPDVLDTWFDSGSMPYAQAHYPFENKKKFEASFPAEFIAEGQDQTRAWFYYLHVLGAALFNKITFKNVIVNGIVLAEDGKKMSKKLQNYPDPNLILEKYGADALRYYLLISPVMHAESLNFSEAGVREMFSKLVNTLYNVLEFYQLFAGSTGGTVILSETKDPSRSKRDSSLPLRMTSANVLDKWILAKLQLLTKEVSDNLENYRLAEASRPIVDFVTELSQWYVRRSRDRFKGADEADKQLALSTLREVLTTLAKLMAPFTPFIAEKIWLAISLPPPQSPPRAGGQATSVQSVHLQEWPKADDKLFDEKVLKEMDAARKIVEMGLSLRAENKIRVRQPLAGLIVNDEHLSHEILNIVADELNVKKVEIAEYEEEKGWSGKQDGKIKVWLNTTIDEGLRKEGLVREIIRAINQLRKDNKLTIDDRVVVKYQTENEELGSVLEEFSDEIQKGVLADKIDAEKNLQGVEISIEDKKIIFNIIIC